MTIPSSRSWVFGLLTLGAVVGLVAAFYRKTPENPVRSAFDRFYAALRRNDREKAALFVASRLRVFDRDMTREEFMKVYEPPQNSGPLEITSCPSDAAHRVVWMNDHGPGTPMGMIPVLGSKPRHKWVHCFRMEEELWKLHWLGTDPCACN